MNEMRKEDMQKELFFSDDWGMNKQTDYIAHINVSWYLDKTPREVHEILRSRPTFEEPAGVEAKPEIRDVDMDISPGETSDDYVIDRKTVCTMTASEAEVNKIVNDYLHKEEPGSSEDETLLPANYSKTKFYSSHLVVRRKYSP